MTPRALVFGTAVASLLAAAPVRAQDDDARLKSGWWESTAGQRDAAAAAVVCGRAAVAGALDLARRYGDSGKPESALRCLDAALKVHPDEGELERARAAYLRRLGRTAEADAAAAKAPAEPAPPASAPERPPAAGDRQAEVHAGGEAAAAERPPATGHREAEARPGGEARAAAAAPPAGDVRAPGEAKESGAPAGGERAEAEAREGEPEGEAEEGAPGVRIGYLHAKTTDETLTDLQVGGTAKTPDVMIDATLHLLKRDADDQEADDFLALSLGHAWAARSWGTTSLLLGLSSGKGEVSPKSDLGLRHVLPFAAAGRLGLELRHVTFADGADNDLRAFASIPVFGPVGLGLAFIDATGDIPGRASTLAIEYEHEGLEGSLFYTSGKGIPAHPFLRPESPDAFTTIGVDLEAELTRHLTVALGGERRTEGDATETELSLGLAWRLQ